MKKHLLMTLILSVFCYLVVSIDQKHLDITLYSDLGSSILAFLIFGLNIVYYVMKYLEGDFTKKED